MMRHDENEERDEVIRHDEQLEMMKYDERINKYET